MLQAVFCNLLLLVFCLFPVAASAVPVVSVSSSGRFLVRGPDLTSNDEVTRCAEETGLRLEAMLGYSLPFSRWNPMEIRLTTNPGAKSSVSEGDEEGRNADRILVINRRTDWDYGAMQEGLVRVVLTSLIERRRQKAGLKGVTVVIPPWLAAGMAQNLDKEMVARNRGIVAMTGLEAEQTPVGDVLNWTRIPEGWHGPPALCGLVMAWILTCPGSLDKIMTRLADQESLSPEWVARTVVGVNTVRQMESRWQAWRERQERVIQEFGALSSAMISQLKGMLPFTGPGIPEAVLFPEEAIGARNKIPVIVPLAQKRIHQIRALTLGKAPELVEVGERYCSFYGGLVRGSWGMVLRWRLARADASLDRLESLTRAREAYLDEFEAEWARIQSAEDSDAWRGDGMGLEKSRMESYLDEAEKRLDKR